MPFRLDEQFARHRLLLTGAVVALTLAAALGNVWLGFDDVPRSVFRSDDAKFALLEEVFRDFGSDDNDCILVVQPAAAREGRAASDLFTPAAVDALRSIVAALAQVDGVEQVRSLVDVVTIDPLGRTKPLLPPPDTDDPAAFDRARRAALANPLVHGQVLSADAQTALIVVRLAGNALSITEIEPRVDDLRAAVEAVGVDDTLWVRLTGVPPIRVEIFNTVRRDSKRFVVIGAALAFVMASILFRRFWGVMIVASAPMLGAFWTMGALGLYGEKLNVINTILPTLVLVIGFTDAVHLMHDIRRSAAEGIAPLEAARLAVRHLWLACFLTSFTTGVGFASLAVAEVDVIQRFGIACAVGVVLAFLAVMTVVPLLSSTSLGRRLVPRHLSQRENWRLRAFDFIVDRVIRHYRAVTIVGVAATLLLLGVALQLRPDNRLTETIPKTNESAQALAHCDEALGGMLMAYALVEWDERYELSSPEVIAALTQAQQLCDDEPGTSYPLSVINLLEVLPGSPGDLAARVPLLALAPTDLVRRFVRTDLRRALITVHLRDRGTAAHMPSFDHLEAAFAELEREYPGIRVQLTGSVVVAGRNINQMIVDLLKSLGLASIVIFGCMTIGFRSWLYGLISIVPNLFPMVATAAILVLLGQPLQLTGVIVFSICLGIAVDDTIHFLARFRRELAVDGDVQAAVRRAFHTVGSALMTTTVVLLTGFASVMTSEMPSSRLFAWMSCAAILSALVGDLLILPSLLTWFAPRKRRRAAAVEPVDTPSAAS